METSVWALRFGVQDRSGARARLPEARDLTLAEGLARLAPSVIFGLTWLSFTMIWGWICFDLALVWVGFGCIWLDFALLWQIIVHYGLA